MSTEEVKNEPVDSEEGSAAFGCGCVLVVLALLGIAGWLGYKWLMPDKSKLETPTTFCGVKFGEKIDLIVRNYSTHDNWKKRNYEHSYCDADFVLKTPFRSFKDGKMLASISSKRVYKAEFQHYFKSKESSQVDLAEFRETVNAIKSKYGEDSVDMSIWRKLGIVGGDFGNNMSWGNYEERFVVGDVIINVRLITEGKLEFGHLVLTAENVKLTAEAEEESQSMYNGKAAKDIESSKKFNDNGTDAL